MLVVLASDSHDNVYMIKSFVRVALELKPAIVLHAGDYSAPFAAKPYAPLGSKLVGVFGNNDAEKELLQRRFSAFGARVTSRFLSIEVGGRRFAVLHGDEVGLLNSLIEMASQTGFYDVIVHGHTHEPRVEKVGRCLVVNPGEICGYLTGESTYAVLNTETLDVEIRRIPREPI